MRETILTNNDARSTTSMSVRRVTHGDVSYETDLVVTEEPLEIQLEYGNAHEKCVKPISVTMRTPGDDFELAAGFLFTEGVVRYADDIKEIGYAATGSNALLSESECSERVCNTVRVRLQPDVTVATATLARNFYTTSSCGVCGKASLLALEAVCPQRIEYGFTADVNMVRGLPGKLLAAQTVFARTGGLHGAGLFTNKGELMHVREDVGRHNAVDKLVGDALLQDRLPLRDCILVLSGRISFELAQKAVMAGIPMIVAVGAPSSLAIRVAERFGMAIAGFVRGERLNIYGDAESFTGF